MNGLIQGSLVVAIVAVATVYAALKLMPAVLRGQVATRVASWAQALGASSERARRVEAKLSSGGACGSCDSCKACATSESETGPDSTFKDIPIRRAR